MPLSGSELGAVAILTVTAVGSLAQVSQVVVTVIRNRRDEVNSKLEPVRAGQFDPMVKKVRTLEFETWFADLKLRREICNYLAIWHHVSMIHCSPRLYEEVVGPHRMAECRAVLEQVKPLVAIARSCDTNLANRLGPPFDDQNRRHVLQKLYSSLNIE